MTSIRFNIDQRLSDLRHAQPNLKLAAAKKRRDWLAGDGVEALASESSDMEQLAQVSSHLVKQSNSWASQGRQPLPLTLRDLGPQTSQTPWHSHHPHFLWYPTR